MSIVIGLGIINQNNKNFVVLEATQDNVQIKLSITDDENYEQDIDIFIEGLQQIKTQMTRAKSGLIAVEGVIPSGLRSIQGGSANSSRSSRKPRTRPSKG